MRNFEVRYPTDGTSALQPELHNCSVKKRAHTFVPRIMRPLLMALKFDRFLPPVQDHAVRSKALFGLYGRGNCRGRAYDRFNTGQAVAGGIVLTACSFAGVLLSL